MFYTIIDEKGYYFDFNNSCWTLNAYDAMVVQIELQKDNVLHKKYRFLENSKTKYFTVIHPHYRYKSHYKDEKLILCYKHIDENIWIKGDVIFNAKIKNH